MTADVEFTPIGFKFSSYDRDTLLNGWSGKINTPSSYSEASAGHITDMGILQRGFNSIYDQEELVAAEAVILLMFSQAAAFGA